MLQPLLYKISLVILRIYAFVMLRLDIYHHTRLGVGAKIFICNHPSGTDPFLIHLAAPREQVNVLITEKAFQVPVFGKFLRAVHEISVPLENGSAALEQAERHLRSGRSVVIFIEGRFSPIAGGFCPPRTGAARLALRTGAPVVPVGVALRRDRIVTIPAKNGDVETDAYWYLRGPYAMTVGDPVRFEGNVDDREFVHHVSDLMMQEIRILAHESERRLRRLKLVPSLT
jgi:1-acyl-sn-glycerol-3-phosphate acyltransferase